jgi:mechanosensitive ion channel-like protein
MVTTAAVDVGASVQQALDRFIGFLPNILAFLVILLVGWLIARLVRGVVTVGLQKVGLDRALAGSTAGTYVERVSPGASPARLIGVLAFWFVFLFALSIAIAALRIPALTGFLNDVQGYLPNVVAAVLIFVAAAALAGLLGGVVRDLMGDTQMGRLLQAVVPGLILAIGTFMVLDQLNIAPQIVTITYAALLGMLALAGALAFGLGGRDVAGRMLEDAYEAGRRGRDRRRDDARVARTQPAGSPSGRLGGAEPTGPVRP